MVVLTDTESSQCQPGIPLFLAYTKIEPTARTCAVSITDSEGITHSAEVSASSRYEAAVLALTEFRRSGIAVVTPGSGTRLRVEVKAPRPLTSCRSGS